MFPNILFYLCQVMLLFFFKKNNKLLKTFLTTTPILHILLNPTFTEHRLLNGFNMSWNPISTYYLNSFQNPVLTKIKVQNMLQEIQITHH